MSENELRCTQNFQESLNNDEDMSGPRTNVDLTTCKRKAEELYLSEHCPCKENGRKEGKRNLTLHFWKKTWVTSI